MNEEVVDLIQRLLSRLERISADSVWAHRASGIRGSLFKAMETLEDGGKVPGSTLDPLISTGFSILENVFKENFRRNTTHR